MNSSQDELPRGQNVALSWKEGLNFSGSAPSGLSLSVSNDKTPEARATAFAPLELMALSLGACTGMDVISILQKKRQQVHAFEVRVESVQAENYPRVWTQARIKYIVTGSDIDPAAVERAIELSAQKYCPVQNMLKLGVELEHNYEIIEG